MKREKKVMFVFVLGIVLVISIGFVSANWFTDLFKFGDEKQAGEGELAAAKQVDMKLTVAGNYPAPDIISISSLGGAMTEVAVAHADRALSAGGVPKPTTISFYVDSPAGPGALPQTSTGTITATNVYVTLVYTGTTPATQPGGKLLTSKGVACTSVLVGSFDTSSGDDIANNNVYGTLTNVVKYTCTVQVPSYTIYGNPALNWDVRGYVEDLSPTPNKEGFDYVDINTGNYFNNVDNVPAGSGPHVLPLRQTYFNKNSDWKIENNAATGVADFGTVNFGDPIDVKPTAVSQPRIVNLGNTYIDKTQLQGNDLQDDPVPTNDASYIPATWFYSDPVDPCLGTAIQIDTTLKDVMQTDIPYGPKIIDATTKDLKICLKKILAGAPTSISAQGYSTSFTGGTPWNVDVAFCGVSTAGGLCP